ncbi:MAG TPA: hypothetical protein VIW45_20435, partial [Vicinamibacterales bacterium]
MREWPLAAAFFAAVALLFTADGFRPHHVMLPLDLPRDAGAWKIDPNQRVVVSNKLLSDAVLEFHAWDIEVRRDLARGEFPWRNRFAGNGAHLFANPESGLLFPLTWLRIAMRDRGWTIWIFIKLWLAGLGMWWLARAMTGCGFRAALLSGFVYATCGYMTAWLLSPHTTVFAMLPWLAAACLTDRIGAVVVTAALAAAAGHPETLFYGVTAIALYLGRRISRATIVAAFLGFAICAVQLVPFAYALAKSDLLAQRAHRPTHLRLFAIPATILPGFLGTPLGSEIDLSGIAQPAAENFAERSGGYAGAVVLLMLIAAWRSLPRRAIVIGIAALVISWIPPGFFPGASERLGLVFCFFAAACAGVAFENYRRAGVIVAIVAGVAALVALFIATPFAQPLLTRAARSGIAMLQQRNYLRLPGAIYEARLTHYLAGFQAVAIRRLAIPLLCIAVAAFTRRRAVVAAAIAVEMIAFAYGYTPIIDTKQIAPAAPAIADVLRLDPEHRFLIAAAPEVYPPNLGTADGVRDIRSYDVLQSHGRIEMLKRLGYDPVDRSFPDVPPPQLARLG